MTIVLLVIGLTLMMIFGTGLVIVYLLFNQQTVWTNSKPVSRYFLEEAPTLRPVDPPPAVLSQAQPDPSIRPIVVELVAPASEPVAELPGLAAIEQARQQAQAEAKARDQEQVKVKAEIPRLVIELAAKYKIKEFDQLQLLQSWIALVLQFALTRFEGDFPVKPVWKAVAQQYRAVAPDSRFTSYVFFARLNDCLIQHRLVDRGRPGIPAKIIRHRLPKWITSHGGLQLNQVSSAGQNGPEVHHENLKPGQDW